MSWSYKPPTEEGWYLVKVERDGVDDLSVEKFAIDYDGELRDQDSIPAEGGYNIYCQFKKIDIEQLARDE